MANLESSASAETEKTKLSPEAATSNGVQDSTTQPEGEANLSKMWTDDLLFEIDKPVYTGFEFEAACKVLLSEMIEPTLNAKATSRLIGYLITECIDPFGYCEQSKEKLFKDIVRRREVKKECTKEITEKAKLVQLQDRYDETKYQYIQRQVGPAKEVVIRRNSAKALAWILENQDAGSGFMGLLCMNFLRAAVKSEASAIDQIRSRFYCTFNCYSHHIWLKSGEIFPEVSVDFIKRLKYVFRRQSKTFIRLISLPLELFFKLRGGYSVLQHALTAFKSYAFATPFSYVGLQTLQVYDDLVTKARMLGLKIGEMVSAADDDLVLSNQLETFFRQLAHVFAVRDRSESDIHALLLFCRILDSECLKEFSAEAMPDLTVFFIGLLNERTDCMLKSHAIRTFERDNPFRLQECLELGRKRRSQMQQASMP